MDSCLVCERPTTHQSGLCANDRRIADGVSVAGWRRGSLEKLIGASKFLSIRAGCRVQADLLLGILPAFIIDTSVIPVPTIRPHIRRRGYGHAELIAIHIANTRKYRYEPIVLRRTNHVQHGASRNDRERQAKLAFSLKGAINPEKMYVVVDDVYTTGATMRAIIRLLKKAGAKHIWIAATSRQPSEKRDIG